MGIYFIATDYMTDSDGNKLDNPTPDQRKKFAERYYSAHNLGTEIEENNILFVVAVDSRDYVTTRTGSGIDRFSDNGIVEIEKQAKALLSNNDWRGAAHVYYETVGKQLSYYETNGKPWEGNNAI